MKQVDLCREVGFVEFIDYWVISSWSLLFILFLFISVC